MNLITMYRSGARWLGLCLAGTPVPDDGGHCYRTLSAGVDKSAAESDWKKNKAKYYFFGGEGGLCVTKYFRRTYCNYSGTSS